MADLKWIKITTDIFDDEKILLIESMPDADAIIVIWFKILCLAGKQNNSGVFMMNDRIAYTEEMLSTIFRRPINTVRMALKIFEEYGMIEIINGVITIPNWEKHQSIDKLEQLRKTSRETSRKYREKQKLLAKSDVTSDVTNTVTVTLGDATEENRRSRIDIIEGVTDKSVKKHYGSFKNVLLTDEEYEKLKEKFTDFEEKIENLSEYIASKGKKYKSHYATILSWSRKDQKETPSKEKVDWKA